MNKFSENDLVARLTLLGSVWARGKKHLLKFFASCQFTFSIKSSYQNDKENLNLNVPRCKVPAK